MAYLKYLGILLTICSTMVHAQKENYNWVFGNKAGLTWINTQSFTGTEPFTTPPQTVPLEKIPKPFVSAVNTGEGCFTVSSPSGELMFYSDGIYIWDKNNSIINQDHYLTGNTSSAQSGLVLPYPNNSEKYITLSLGTEVTSNGVTTSSDFAWNVVSKLNNTVQLEAPYNRIITPPTNYMYKEIVGAVRTKNKKDYWIIIPARKKNTTDNYVLHVYKVDENGVNSTPDHTFMTTIRATTTSYGQLKFNKAGDRFVLVSHNRGGNNVLVGAFNSENGQITILAERTLGINNEQVYSPEFDPTDQYLYITSIGINNTAPNKYTLYAFKVEDFINMQNPTSSLRDYGKKSNTIEGNSFGAILRGIDDRLYIADYNSSHVFVIPNPSDPENLKIVRLTNILGSSKSMFGLPSYASFYVNTSSEVIQENKCKESPLELNINITAGEGFSTYDKIKIDFGDGLVLPFTEIRETNTPANPDILDQLIITQNPSTNDINIKVKHIYKNGGEYVIKASIYDVNNLEILEASTSKIAEINTCHLKVNPHIRINL